MKFGIAFFAALAVVACGRIAAAGEVDKAVVIKVADLAVPEPPRRHHRRHHRRHSEEREPLACESVLFPRSPLCEGRPAAFGPYAPAPWDQYVAH
jgi:hypothetical protein